MGIVHALFLMGFSAFLWANGVAENPIFVVMGEWDLFRGIQLIFDQTTILFIATTGLIYFSVLIYCWKRYSQWTFFFLLNMMICTVISVFYSLDLFNAYVCMELFSLVVYLLISFSRRRKQLWAGLKYLLLSAVALNLYLVGVALVYNQTGTLNLLTLHGNEGIPRIGIMLIVGALLVKTGVFFFSMWLPNAHGEADAPVSALLSGLVVKAGYIFLFRIVQALPEPWLTETILHIGWMSALFGGILAFVQTDIKYLLAFSTMSQMGFALCGIASAGISFTLNHALLKGSWFMMAGLIHEWSGMRNLKDLQNARKPFHPLFRLFVLIGFLGVCGIPPFGNTLCKGAIVYGLPEPIQYVLIASSVLSVAYFSKILFAVFLGKRSEGKSTGWTVQAFLPPLLLPLAAIVGLGILYRGEWLSSVLMTGAGIALHWVFGKKLALGYPEKAFRLNRILTLYMLLIAGIALIWIQY